MTKHTQPHTHTCTHTHTHAHARTHTHTLSLSLSLSLSLYLCLSHAHTHSDASLTHLYSRERGQSEIETGMLSSTLGTNHGALQQDTHNALQQDTYDVHAVLQHLTISIQGLLHCCEQQLQSRSEAWKGAEMVIEGERDEERRIWELERDMWERQRVEYLDRIAEMEQEGEVSNLCTRIFIIYTRIIYMCITRQYIQMRPQRALSKNVHKQS